MKRKSIAILLSVVLMLVIMLTACNCKKHKFSTEWKYDDTSHWHECLKKKHSDVADKAEHTFNEGVVTTAPTETSEGVLTLTCTVCGYQKTKSIEKVKHVHTFNDKVWQTDENNHWHPATCAHTDEKGSFGKHVWDEGKTSIPADYGKAGEKTFTCTECKATKTEPIAALDSKENTLSLAKENILSKTYDGTPFALTVAEFVYNGDGKVAFSYKLKVEGDDKYTEQAPTNAGEYIVKVSIQGTSEWKEIEGTFDLIIVKKALSITGTKIYDANEIITNDKITITGVLEGDEVSATITMTSYDVNSVVNYAILDGKDKDNYMVDEQDITASIYPLPISVEWELKYNNSNIIIGEPAELFEGDDVTITITMKSANVGAEIESFKMTGSEADNYSLAEEDIFVDIVKATIGDNFTISNANEYNTPFKVGAEIPEPQTNYEEVGTGYGAKSVIWEKKNSSGKWEPTTKELIMKSKGEYRVSIKYVEGVNYEAASTGIVNFIVEAKGRGITANSNVIQNKTYDYKPVDKMTYADLVNKVTSPNLIGVTNYTESTSGDKYVEYRKKGERNWTRVTSANVPVNSGEYEYRIGITETNEWVAVVSDVKTFKITPYEFVLELGYGQNQNNPSYDRGKTFQLRTYSELIPGQTLELWLDNEKAGFETKEGNYGVYYFVPDNKKKVSPDCFFLKIKNISSPNMENYKIVTKYSYVTTVEITVVEGLTSVIKGKSGTITNVGYTTTETVLTATVEKGYFKVGKTIEIYNASGVKVGEAVITKVNIGTAASQSGFAIPSDGTVSIWVDKGFMDPATNKPIPIKDGYFVMK